MSKKKQKINLKPDVSSDVPLSADSKEFLVAILVDFLNYRSDKLFDLNFPSLIPEDVIARDFLNSLKI